MKRAASVACGWMLAAIAILSMAPSSALAQRATLDRRELETFLDAFFAQQLAELHIPGAAVAVVQDGQILACKGYGLAEVEGSAPVDAQETVLRIGSISKLFVATAVMQLVEQGRLDLHADVNRYLTTFQIHDRYREPVTLAHLLTHTAGFGDAWSNTTDPTAIRPLGTYLAAHMPPRFVSPGQIISYSSHGYALAGYVVQEVTGIPFDQYVQRHILQPLGMEHSGYLLSPPFPQGLATGYVYQNGAYVPQPVDYDDDYPGGSLASTAADMARFMIAHLAGGCGEQGCILGPETIAEMHRQQFTHHPQLPGWTYGFQEEFLPGGRAIGHSGGIRGFTSDLALLPEHGVGYFLSANIESMGGAGPRLLTAFEEQFMARFFTPEPAAQPGPLQEDLSGLAGQYRYTRYYRHTVLKIDVLAQDLSVVVSGDGLVVAGARTLAFTRSRRGAESVATATRAHLAEVDGVLLPYITPQTTRMSWFGNIKKSPRPISKNSPANFSYPKT